MSEWWTYSLRDLLLFSPQTYYRLFELHNSAWWPLPIFTVALGVALLVLGWRGGDRAGRVIAVMLALAWLWIAWGFHAQRYASINLAAKYFAWAFAAQGLLLLAWGVMGGRLKSLKSRSVQTRFGLGLLLFALFGVPLLGPLLGRNLAQAEVFGMAPDPTALATLGVLLLAHGRHTYVLYPIPLAWCLISGATLWAMEAPDFAIMPIAALLAVGAAVGEALVRRSPYRASDRK